MATRPRHVVRNDGKAMVVARSPAQHHERPIPGGQQAVIPVPYLEQGQGIQIRAGRDGVIKEIFIAPEEIVVVMERGIVEFMNTPPKGR